MKRVLGLQKLALSKMADSVEKNGHGGGNSNLSILCHSSQSTTLCL